MRQYSQDSEMMIEFIKYLSAVPTAINCSKTTVEVFIKMVQVFTINFHKMEEEIYL